MDHVSRIHEIAIRLEQIESTGDWLARMLVHSDGAASQAGSMVTVLAQDVRERLLELVTELEKEVVVAQRERHH